MSLAMLFCDIEMESPGCDLPFILPVLPTLLPPLVAPILSPELFEPPELILCSMINGRNSLIQRQSLFNL